MTDKRIMQMRDRQRRVFRIACDPTRYGLTLKMIAVDADLHYDSVRDYASGKTTMPVTAVDALIDVIPDELLSYLFSGDRSIVRIPDEVDHHEIGSAMADYLRAKSAAHHPQSENGEAIGPSECADLRAKLATVKAA